MNFVDIYQKYWKNGYTLTDLSLSGIDREVFRSLFNPVAEVFRKYPVGDVHLYIPGVGQVNGFQPGNYFDSAGTTQASVDGSVGLVLDAAGSVGAELAPVSSATITDLGGGRYRVEANTTGRLYFGAANLKNGATYRLSFNIESYTGSSTFNSDWCDVAGGYPSTPLFVGGVSYHASRATYDSTYRFLDITTGAGTTLTINTVRAQEVTGIHATQSTPGYKPTLRKGIVNLLTYSNDLTNAVWSKVATSIVGGQSDPYGGASAQGINDTGANAAHYIQQSYSYIAGSAYSLCRVVKAGGTGFVQIPFESAAFSGNLFANFDLTSGAVGNKSGSVTASIAPLGNGFFLCVASAVATSTASGNTHLWLLNSNGLSFAPAYTGSGGTALYHYTSGNFQGTLTAAQIIAAGGIPLTLTAPASSQAGVNYLEFDGVDGNLQLPSPIFQQVDNHCVIVAASPSIIDGTYRRIFTQENGSATAAEMEYTVVGVNVTWRDNTPTAVSLVGPVPTLNTPFVFSARKIGDTRIGRFNGVEFGSNTTPLGATTLNPVAYFGNRSALDRQFKGKLYPAIIIKGTVSDADLVVLEKFVAQLSGVQL